MIREDNVPQKVEVRKYIQDFDRKTPEGREHLRDLGADGRIILK
jgi:hypothetical protein